MHFIVMVLVSAAVFVSGRNGSVAAVAPVAFPATARPGAASPATDSAGGFSWQLQGTFGSAVFIDLSMADDSVGFACAELGVVYRTTNSGASWTRVMNLGFPYYWYGVSALSRQQVLVAGFNDTSGAGIYRWSHDGGESWDSIVALDTANWLSRARFVDSLRGIICAGWNGGIWRTSNGGRNAADWSYVQVDPARGWFEGNFCYKPDSSCYTAGISFSRSYDDGDTWDAEHSADPVFDGGVWFADSLHGWTGGGQISSPVSGWVHRTTDGGGSWSDRLLETPAPVRAVLFLNDTLGFAVGGNVYTGAGFIYSTVDGGDSWRLDVNTGSEMKAIDFKAVGDSVDLWCCGFNSGFTGCIYKTRIAPQSSAVAERHTPYAERTTVPTIVRGVLSMPASWVMRHESCVLMDVRGREVMTVQPGPNDVSHLPAGVYFVCSQPSAVSCKPSAIRKVLLAR